MSFRKDKRGVIRLHDATDHGGEVIKVLHSPTVTGRPVACVGDLVRCPKCNNGVFRIVEGDEHVTIEGTPVAFHGHKTACGARLISSVDE